MAWTTGNDNAKESRCANGPSTPTNGVRMPAARQIDCSLFAIAPVYHAPRAAPSPEGHWQRFLEKTGPNPSPRNVAGWTTPRGARANFQTRPDRRRTLADVMCAV